MLRRINPGARIALARVLAMRSPTLSPEKAVDNATAIIRALHSVGMEVGPMACFGPHDQPAETDVFGGFVSLMKDWEARKPWFPEGESPSSPPASRTAVPPSPGTV